MLASTPPMQDLCMEFILCGASGINPSDRQLVALFAKIKPDMILNLGQQVVVAGASCHDESWPANCSQCLSWLGGGLHLKCFPRLSFDSPLHPSSDISRLG